MQSELCTGTIDSLCGENGSPSGSDITFSENPWINQDVRNGMQEVKVLMYAGEMTFRITKAAENNSFLSGFLITASSDSLIRFTRQTVALELTILVLAASISNLKTELPDSWSHLRRMVRVLQKEFCLGTFQ